MNPELPLSSRLMTLRDFDAGKYSIMIASDMPIADLTKIDHSKIKEAIEEAKIDIEFNVSHGIDFKNVQNVLNFDLPMNVDNYINRVGRTARSNAVGYALTFITEENSKKDNANILEQVQDATDITIHNFNFKIDEISGLRYRCNVIFSQNCIFCLFLFLMCNYVF